MYTRCPECRTPFRVTRAQLSARDGMVRCGKCQAVFSATEHLLWFAPARETDATPKPRRGRRRRSRRDTGALAHDPAIPTISELSFARRRRRLHPAVWGLVNVILLAALIGQGAYFYRNEIAAHPPLRPWMETVCDWLECELAPTRPWVAPEIGATTIAPHPRFANALRLRATLVNRGAAPMLHPRLEVALTDSSGTVLARRIFEPHEYLETPAANMPPNVAVPALLDLTNPDDRAVGYEIKLLPPGDAETD